MAKKRRKKKSEFRGGKSRRCVTEKKTSGDLERPYKHRVHK